MWTTTITNEFIYQTNTVTKQNGSNRYSNEKPKISNNEISKQNTAVGMMFYISHENTIKRILGGFAHVVNTFNISHSAIYLQYERNNNNNQRKNKNYIDLMGIFCIHMY